MTPYERQQRALATLEAAGINLQNSKPDHHPRRWFAGPTSPTIHGTEELETVAYYVDLATQQEETT